MQRLHDFCTMDGCGREHHARGYCGTHYAMFKRGVKVVAKIKTRVAIKPEHCQEEGCFNVVKGKGMCAMHYARYLRHGHTKYRDRKKPPKFCRIEGCENYLYANSLCHSHNTKDKAWRNFGLTIDDYQKMLVDQKGVCKICSKNETNLHNLSRKTKTLSMDHCHATNKIRGLLCSACNTALGLFQDSEDVLQKAIEYLQAAKGHSVEPKSTG